MQTAASHRRRSKALAGLQDAVQQRSLPVQPEKLSSRSWLSRMLRAWGQRSLKDGARLLRLAGQDSFGHSPMSLSHFGIECWKPRLLDFLLSSLQQIRDDASLSVNSLADALVLLRLRRRSELGPKKPDAYKGRTFPDTSSLSHCIHACQNAAGERDRLWNAD